jgi:hypothetical protein
VTATKTTLSDILFRRYPQKSLPLALYKESPLFGMMAKDEDHRGEDTRLSLAFAPTGGRSADFATAQANKRGAGYRGFLLTHYEDYSIFSLTGLALAVAKKSKGALVNALEKEGEMCLKALKKSMCATLYGNGGGAIGRVGSTSTTVLTLSNPADIVNFEVGQVVVSGSTDGTSGTPDNDAALITGINRAAGTITRSDANWTTATHFANGDYLFIEGDHTSAAIEKPPGLAGWLPASAPVLGSDSFKGVDRGADATRLGGWRVTASQEHGTLERLLIDVEAQLDTEGGAPDVVVMNPRDRAILVNELGAKAQYDRATARGSSGAIADIGYKTLMLHGNNELKVIGDRYCPRHRAYMLDMSTWKIYSAGSCPGWLREDGQDILREAAADAYEGRMGVYWDIGCEVPGHNATIDLSAITNPS